MNKKIELIPEDGNTGRWHWIIMEYNDGWYNAGCGMEASYEEAAAEAKKALEDMA